jgi:signal transduction histidine kinase
LRTRLALALLAVFVPVSILVFVSHLENLEDQRQQRAESLGTIGETIAAVVDGFSRDLESFSLSTSITLSEIASLPPSDSGQTAFRQETLGPYFAHLSESYGILRAIFVTDLDGRVLASDSGESNGLDLSGRSYIQALKNGAETVWSEAVNGLQTGQSTIAYGRVIATNTGEPRYFLIIAFYPQSLATRLPGDLPPDAHVSLIDANGVVMYNSTNTDPQAPLEDVSSSPLFQQARDGSTVLIQSEPTPLDSNDRYGAFVPLERTGWIVGFSRPASVVDGPVEARFRRDVAIVGGILAGGFVAMYFIASRLARPLTTLAQAAGAISRGEKPTTPVHATDAEVNQLVEAMEGMSRAVEERETLLRAQTRVLETLEAVGEALATELDFTKAVTSISEAGIALTGAQSAGFFHKASAESDQLTLLGLAGGYAFPLAEDDPLVAQTLSGQMLYVPDIASSPGAPRILASDGSVVAKSLLGLPLKSRQGDSFGGLFLLHSKAGAFTEEHQRLALGLARRASVVIENAGLYGEAKEVQEELRRANQAKTEFIGVMSHELRTPITTIYGGARLLHNRRKSLQDDAAEEMIASIEEEAERLYRLVENLLALARSDLGQEVVPDVVPIGPVIDQTVRQFTNRHPGRPVEVHLEEQLPLALAETTYVQQVLHNLITNSDKYSDTGLPIEIDVKASNDEITVSVLDHGPGVPAEEIDQIFESFYRSQRTARQASGKGLGLTVCKRLIEVMGGRIWARQREGGGLEVAFALPVAAEGEPELEPASRQT